MTEFTAPPAQAAYSTEASSSPVGEGTSSFTLATIFGWAGLNARPRSFLPALLLAALTAGMTLGCSFVVEKPPKVLLLGMDGLEWEVLLPLMQAGQLPNFSALVDEGVAGRLDTSRPTFSPIIWTSIATGKPPNEHGIRGFVRRGEGERRLYSSLDRRSKAFWNVLSDYAKRVAVVGWWVTFPVEEINGVMVAQAHTMDQARRAKGRAILKGGLRADLAGQIYPAERSSELLATHERVQEELDARLLELFGPVPATMSPLVERLWVNTRWAFQADATYLEIAKTLASEEHDLLACYFGGADVAGHRFWRYMRPGLYRDQPDRAEYEWFGKVIPKYYGFLDAALGELRAKLPPETLVIVLSDHGMRPVNRKQRFDADDLPAQINSGHHHGAPPGILIAAGGSVAPSGEALSDQPTGLPTLGTIYDVLPTLLATFGLPSAEDLQGKAISEIAAENSERVATFDSVEWLEARGAPPGETSSKNGERLKQLRALGYID